MMKVAVLLITLNGPDGQEIFVNPQEVVSLRELRESSRDLFAEGIRCVLQTADGKIVNVIDNCSTVRLKMHEAEQ